MLPAQLRPLSFGEVLDGAFTLYRRHFVTLFLTSLVPQVPLAIAMVGFLRQIQDARAAAVMGSTDAVGRAMGYLLLLVMASAVCYTLVWAALGRQASQAYTAAEVSVGDGFRRALRGFLPLLGVALVAGIAGLALSITVVLLASWIVAPVLGPTAPVTPVVVGVFFLVGMLAVWASIGTWLFAVVPAVVVERRGPFEAIGRSLALVKGAYWRVLGLLAVCGLMMWLPVMGISLLTGQAAGLGAASPFAAVDRAVYFQQVASTVIWALTTPYLLAAVVLLYYDRRVRTEAYDLEVAAEHLAVA
jgi:hypothetical protein